MILSLIWRNLWRNRRRTVITMTSVLFAVMLAILFKSLQVGVFDNLIKNVVRFYSGYIQLHRKGYSDEQVLDNGFAWNDDIGNTLDTVPGLLSYVRRIESYALVSSGTLTRGCYVVGTDPAAEDRLTGLRAKIVSGSYFQAASASVIIAKGLAGKLQLQAGDTLVLLGQGYHGQNAAGKYPIAAVAEFGSPQLNESIVYLPLVLAQHFFSAEGLVTTVALDVRDPEHLDAIKQALLESLPDGFEALTWPEMMPEISNHMKADNAGLYIELGILYMVIAFGIFGTLLMMVSERRREFGMLIAIGMKKTKVAIMLVGETVLVSLLGTLGGMAVSLPFVLWFAVHPIRFGGQYKEVLMKFGFEPVYPTAVQASIFLNQGLAVLALSLLIALFPLLIIRKTEPATALKR